MRGRDWGRVVEIDDVELLLRGQPAPAPTRRAVLAPRRVVPPAGLRAPAGGRSGSRQGVEGGVGRTGEVKGSDNGAGRVREEEGEGQHTARRKAAVIKIVVGTGSMGRRKKGLKEGSSGRKEGRRKGREGVIEGAAEGGRGGGAQRVGEGAGAGSVWTQQETSVFLPDFPADHKLTPHPPYSVKKDR